MRKVGYGTRFSSGLLRVRSQELSSLTGGLRAGVPFEILNSRIGVQYVRHLANLVCVFLAASCTAANGNQQIQNARDSANLSVGYMASAMDFDRSSLWVYRGGGAPENHFLVWGRMPPSDGYTIATSDTVTVDTDGYDTSHAQPGSTCIRCTFVPKPGINFGGFMFLNGARILDLDKGRQLALEHKPPTNHLTKTEWQRQFGEVKGAAMNLSGALRLRFRARGEQGGEKVQFFIGDVQPDSSRTYKPVQLTKEWTDYEIPLNGVDLRYIQNGFAWVVKGEENPDSQRVQFYIDQIQYEFDHDKLDRWKGEARFIKSYTTASFDPSDPSSLGDQFDYVYLGVADLYDNALAILALLADGKEESIGRAVRIGDAIRFAAEHDRILNDVLSDRRVDKIGEGWELLRSHYSVGESRIPFGWSVTSSTHTDGKTNLSALPTFYIPPYQDSQHQWQGDSSLEISDPTATVDPRRPNHDPTKFHSGIVDTGNNAWAIIALTSLYNATGNERFLTCAKSIGNAIRGLFFRKGSKSNGYLGGLEDVDSGLPDDFRGFPENPSPSADPLDPIHLRSYASTEHNIDLCAAYHLLSEATGDNRWQAYAEDARSFVESMWKGDLLDSGTGAGVDGPPNTMTDGDDPDKPRGPNFNAPVPLDIQCWSTLAIPGFAERHRDILKSALQRFAWQDGLTFSAPCFESRQGVWSEGTAHMAVALQQPGPAQDLKRAEELLTTLRRMQIGDGKGKGGSLATDKADGVDTGYGFLYQHRPHLGGTAWNVFAQLNRNPYHLTFSTKTRILPDGETSNYDYRTFDPHAR